MNAGISIAQRGWRELMTNGPAVLSAKVGRRALRWVNERGEQALGDLPLRPEHVYGGAAVVVPARYARAGRLHIGWVCTPPGPGSGGHTTLFRMVRSAELAGHDCTLFLYDRSGDDAARHEAVIRRWWPDVRARIASATSGSLEGVDAVVASSWITAHVVARRFGGSCPAFYFIQDYEPYFYPHGSLYQLAESTYGFGFTCIALGSMVADTMKHELGRSPDFVVPFACDTSVYRILKKPADSPGRHGVVFYAKRNVPRRGYAMGKLALEIFHEEHPDQPVHVYGDAVGRWPFPIVNHRTLAPADLNALYNSTIAGLTLSFTNITLTASEMMAAGNVPVMNDLPGSRSVLGADGAIWRAPNPEDLAEGLCQAVEHSDIAGRAALLADQSWPGWEQTGQATVAAIEKTVSGASESAPRRSGIEG